MSNLIASHAFVTGANRGLGLEFVKQLIPRTERLFAACRTPSEADALNALADEHPGTVHVLELDVADPDAMDAALDAVREVTSSLDLLINNAGINGSGSGDRFGSLEADTMTHVLRVNTVAPHILAQKAVDLLEAGAEQQGTAKVINITSQLGSIARVQSQAGWHSYRASKAGLNMLTRLLSYDLKPYGVIAIAMHPGWVQTDMGGANAAITPETSIAGILDVTERLTIDDTGTYIDYQGNALPW